MTVAVVVPWRGGQPDRERHHATIRAHMQHLLPDAIHLDVDSGHQPFSRAGSRNLGVHLAGQAGADVVVLCDADTIVEPTPLHEAIAAAGDGRLHLPFTRFRGLSKAAGWAPCIDPAGLPIESETEWSSGGVLVIQPASWWRAGGMDERLIGWGFEDSCFVIAADALLGKTMRHAGTIYHLWHPENRSGHPNYRSNMDLAHRYDAAYGDAERVRALIAERESSALTR